MGRRTGVHGEARVVVVYQAAVLLLGKTGGFGIASSLELKTPLVCHTCMSSPIRSSGSAIEVVLPVLDKSRRIDT